MCHSMFYQLFPANPTLRNSLKPCLHLLGLQLEHTWRLAALLKSHRRRSPLIDRYACHPLKAWST